jgi:hypothetical protein
MPVAQRLKALDASRKILVDEDRRLFTRQPSVFPLGNACVYKMNQLMWNDFMSLKR